jgi:S-(hydroxymethyl)glutathione dehydrogenase/alcohol dehydrogenase
VTRAAVVTAFGEPLVVEEIALRPPGDGEAMVRIDATAMCVTDVLAMGGFTYAPLPMVPGHAAAGVVEAVGPGTDRVTVGQRVVVVGSTECRACYSCVHGCPSACDQIQLGMVPPRQVATRADGTAVTSESGIATMTERMNLRQVNLVPVESDLPAEHLCLLGCGVISGLGAVLSVARVRPGESVAVVGCGHLGLWMIQAARLAGARRIVAVEPDRTRRELAGALGATDLVDPAEAHPVRQVKALTGGRGVDTSFEAAGSTDAMRHSFLMARPGGTVVATGVAGTGASVTLPALEYALGARRILSSQSGGGHLYRDVPRFAAMLAAGLVDPRPIVSRTFPLDEINQAVGAARDRTVVTGVVLSHPRAMLPR